MNRFTRPARNDADMRQKPRNQTQQHHDRYMNLAQEALNYGDRVMAEYYFQFAEHYLRAVQHHAAHMQNVRPMRQPGTSQTKNFSEKEHSETTQFAPSSHTKLSFSAKEDQNPLL